MKLRINSHSIKGVVSKLTCNHSVTQRKTRSMCILNCAVSDMTNLIEPRTITRK